ncbi:MAG: hypothetical protein J6Y97_09710, partial [Prevotella sp.]|nr:hypothetical protein [Prevotella sp.]
MSNNPKTFRFSVKNIQKYLEVPNVVCTFAFAALEKWGSKNDKKKRSLIGFHEDREVVQEAPALPF